MGSRYLLAAGCACALAASLAVSAVHGQQVLRGGAHLVQVDAYPLRDGQPIKGLTAADLELFEDGKPQQIDSVRFLEFPIWTPEAVRRDPNTQRESFDLAADPSNRLFVVYLNRFPWQRGNLVEPALFDFLDRAMGPRDYVGIMTAMQSPGDLVFGQLTTTSKGEISRFLNIVDPMDPKFMSGEELELLTCFPGGEGENLIIRRRSDDVYRDLEGIVTLLGSLRETQSTLIVVSEQMIDPRQHRQLTERSRQPAGGLAPVQLMPPPGGRGTFAAPGRVIEISRCEDLKKATLEPWSPDRFRALVAQARAANVALNPINPRGLFASADVAAIDAETANDELMRTMANETGGVAMVTTNDMREAFRRITGALTSHYLLGYYSSNRNPDGRLRKITVKLKASGETIRARREYRAPRAEEVTAPASTAAASPTAPAVPEGFQAAVQDLDRIERDSSETRSPERADARVLPKVFRAASPPVAPWQPSPQRQFSRTERLKVEWPTAEGSAAATVRLLDRTGRALPLAPTVTQSGGAVTATMALSPLAAGLYVLEATLPDGTVQHLAFRIS
jgi:VWFA-related protein